MVRRSTHALFLLASVGCRTFLPAPDERTGDGGPGPDAGLPGRDDASTGTHDAAAPSCEQACVTSDLSHCSARCELGQDGAARCVVRGLDQDGDGHADARCAGDAPGDDCDDRDEAIHPGALEQCDGFDNDCNGRIDLQDGLPASPPDELYLGGQNPALAWDGKAFAMAYEGEGHELLFAKFSAAGKRLFDRAELAPHETPDADGAAAYPSLQWGGAEFGVTWTRAPQVHFVRIDGDGTRRGDIVNLARGDEAGLGRSFTVSLGNGRWLAGFGHGGTSTVSASVVADDGSLQPTGLAGEATGVGVPSLTVIDNALASIWQQVDQSSSFYDVTSSVWWVRRTLGLDTVSPGYTQLVLLSAPSHAGFPVIASSAHGYALAWVEVVVSPGGYERRLMFQEFDLEGSQRCGPVDLARGFDPSALPAEPVSMAYGGDSYVMLLHVPLPSGSASSGVDLLQVRPGCEYVQRFRAQRTRGSSLPALASAGDGGFLLAWQDSSVSHPTLSVQKLGPHLCD